MNRLDFVIEGKEVGEQELRETNRKLREENKKNKKEISQLQIKISQLEETLQTLLKSVGNPNQFYYTTDTNTGAGSPSTITTTSTGLLTGNIAQLTGSNISYTIAGNTQFLNTY